MNHQHRTLFSDPAPGEVKHGWFHTWRERNANPIRCIKQHGGPLLFLTVMFLLVWRAPPQHAFEGIARYTWLHSTLEMFFIVVAGMVFGVAWNAYSRERPGHILLLASGLLTTGILNLLHMLSFAGMPDFVTPAGPEKAINFWLASRFLFAVILLWVAFRPWRPLAHPSLRYVQLVLGLAFAAIVAWVGLFHQDILPRTFIAGQGLTPIKVGAEYAIIGMFALAAMAFLRAFRQESTYNISGMFAAAVVSILSELCFTLYSDVTDIFNLLGHVYNVVAYAFVYHAVFVCSVREPFERLVSAEAKTRAASAYARSLIEASLDPLLTIDPDGKLTDANHATEGATGLPRAELLGTDFADCFTEPDKARAIYGNVIERGSLRDYPLVMRRRDGVLADVLCNASMYCSEDGGVEGVFVAARDVTEAKRTERALVRAHALLANITDTSPIGIAVWSLDGRMTFANAEAQQILGRDREEIRQLSYNAEQWRITDFGGSPIADEELPFRKVASTGQALYELEMAIEARDGRRALLLVNASPLLDEHGKLEGVVTTIDDVTQRKAAELQLRASEERLKVAMAAAHMGAWTWDVEKDEISYSDDFSALLGLPKGVERLSRAAFVETVYAPDRADVRAALDHALVLEQGHWVDFRVVWPDRSVHWVSVHATVTRDTARRQQKVSGLGFDITERKQNQLALERANRALRTLSAGNDRLIHAEDEPSLLNAVCRVVVDVGGYRMAWVGKAIDDAEKSVRPVAVCGDEQRLLENTSVVWADTPLGHGTTGTAIRTGITQVNQNYANNPMMGPWRDEALKRGYQASIAFPLRDASGVYGALTIYAGEPDAFNPDEVKLLQEMADDVSFGIVTLRTRAERDRMAEDQHQHDLVLRDSLVDSIQAIAATLEMRDPYTAGHQRRVATLATAIAHKMGLPESRIEGIHLAASIHDVGKIHIPSEILNRPGRISALEMELIRGHARAGHDIVKDIRFPWPISRIILEHHEHIDGTGYPNRLKGEDILLESRIVTVADVVEAMTSHRPYRPGLGLEVALEHVTQYRGQWYDADAVDACLGVIRDGTFSFERKPGEFV